MGDQPRLSVQAHIPLTSPSFQAYHLFPAGRIQETGKVDCHCTGQTAHATLSGGVPKFIPLGEDHWALSFTQRTNRAFIYNHHRRHWAQCESSGQLSMLGELWSSLSLFLFLCPPFLSLSSPPLLSSLWVAEDKHISWRGIQIPLDRKLCFLSEE